MLAANFTLEHIFYPETSVKANINFNRGYSEAEPNEAQAKIYVYKQESTAVTVAMRVTVSATSPADPYDIEVTAVGRFAIKDDEKREERFAHAIVSAPNILYGAIREHVLGITARSAWNEHVLGPVTFDADDYELAKTESE
ncbi:hypothetical protein EGJ23_12080 [Pseudomonas sp. o96-267]|uniref:protein-export chaperone SecB n=1 Tax=Pseudomonas sp. o96-267 TaxID=2479853 RepID=UPI000F7AC7CB|nr:protein-export chaperone SecB [Pseudomonas sp. o96-267]RRV26756.1 hypothetical protein EGJ23_12080 [Pseudomonas sp. o96-267]